MIRLRPRHSDEELARIYAVPHAHHLWKDHLLRVQATIAQTSWFESVQSAGDLSCGDGTILNALNAEHSYYGDYAPGYQFTGPLEETIDQMPPVDLYIMSETIEHLDDPLLALKKIRAKTKYLVLSTPLEEDPSIVNEQHYWSFTKDDITGLLRAADFRPVVYQQLEFSDPEYCYNYQIHGAK